MPPYRPKKRLGQNFLIDDSISRKIIESIDPQPGDQVVEIGPGQGALTEHLLNKSCLVTAVEFDRDLIPALKAKFGKRDNFKLHAGDFLRITAVDLPEKAKIIGNLPYNISTAIIEHLQQFKLQVVCAVFTVQLEVGQRLISPPGKRDYGSLTVLLAASFDIVHLFTIPPQAFSPPPKIHSAVIKLTPVNREPDDFPGFKNFIHGCFKYKRKTLINSMESGLELPKTKCEDMLDRMGFAHNIRAEQLSFDNYVELFKLWRVVR